MREIREAIKDFRTSGAADVETFADMVSQIDTPQGLAKFAQDARKATVPEKLIEIWINSLLSGPQTHAVNILSNELVSYYTVPETYLAGTAGAVRSGISQILGRGRATDRVFIREGTARLFAIPESAKDGLVLAGKSFFTGEGFDATTKFENMKFRSIQSPIGTVIRIPGRALMSADEFYKARGRRQELNALGVRDAAQKGLEGREFSSHVRDFVQNPPEGAAESALHASRKQTFTEPLGEVGQGAQKLFSTPPGKLINPFIRVMTNIFKFSAERSPLGLAMKDVRADIKAGGARRDIAIARMAFSTAIGAWVAKESASGNITGSGPSDPESRRIWFLTHRPYSFRIPSEFASQIEQTFGTDIGERLEQTGDLWISYARLEPIGTIVGVSADFAEIAGHIEEGESDKIAGQIVISINKNITNKTFLQGMSRAAMALTDPDRYGPRFVQQLVGTVVPTGVAQLERVKDPILRDVKSIEDQIKSRIPGYSTDLPPRRNLWGEPIILDGGLGPDIVSPLYSHREVPDKTSEEVWRLQAEISPPSRTIAGVELTRQEYDDLLKETGQLSKRVLDLMIVNVVWDGISDRTQKMLIEKEYNAVKQAIREKIISRIQATEPSRIIEAEKKKLDIQ
jgi:hypothetical protein